MTITCQASDDPKDRLLHSIHNTSRKGVKLALCQSKKYESALGLFANLQNIFTNCLNPKYHSSVFVPGGKPKLSGRQVDSISSGNYASYADLLLSEYNPQTGEVETQNQDYVPPVVIRHRLAVLTYVQATSPTNVPVIVIPTIPPTVSSVSNDDTDRMFATFTQKFSASLGSSLTIQALEKQVQQTSGELQEVKATFQTQMQTVIDQNANITNDMKSLNDIISRQNFVIACIQQEFKDTIADLYSKLHLAPPGQNSAGTGPGIPVTPTTAPHTATIGEVGGALSRGPLGLVAAALQPQLARLLLRLEVFSNHSSPSLQPPVHLSTIDVYTTLNPPFNITITQFVTTSQLSIMHFFRKPSTPLVGTSLSTPSTPRKTTTNMAHLEQVTPRHLKFSPPGRTPTNQPPTRTQTKLTQFFQPIRSGPTPTGDRRPPTVQAQVAPQSSPVIPVAGSRRSRRSLLWQNILQ
jgi:hypothetical protein